MPNNKCNILILGGCGFIGRNLVTYLIQNDLANFIRVVDKIPPQVAWLNKQHSASFESNNDVLEFRSANLINSESCKNVFELKEGIHEWDVVVNCAGETRSAQTDPVYKEGILTLSLNCARLAAETHVKHYVELSSGNMSSSEKTAHNEASGTEPWTFVAKWKREVEKQLADIPNLNYTILRLPIVYGLGDKFYLTPRIITAAIYRRVRTDMKLLWTADLKLNTVHVDDVCRAIWFVATREDTLGQIYNVVDDSNSTQGTVWSLLADIFNIKVDYYGNIISQLVDLVGAVADINDEHVIPWAEACRQDDIENTPLSPHIVSEVLLHKHLHLDGTKLRKLGFELSVAKPTVENLRQVMEDYVAMGVFPKSLLP